MGLNDGAENDYNDEDTQSENAGLELVFVFEENESGQSIEGGQSKPVWNLVESLHYIIFKSLKEKRRKLKSNINIQNQQNIFEIIKTIINISFYIIFCQFMIN